MHEVCYGLFDLLCRHIEPDGFGWMSDPEDPEYSYPVGYRDFVS